MEIHSLHYPTVENHGLILSASSLIYQWKKAWERFEWTSLLLACRGSSGGQPTRGERHIKDGDYFRQRSTRHALFAVKYPDHQHASSAADSCSQEWQWIGKVSLSKLDLCGKKKGGKICPKFIGKPAVVVVIILHFSSLKYFNVSETITPSN